jgi:hypothetical protein
VSVLPRIYVSETGFYVRPQVKVYSVGPNPDLGSEIGTSSIDFAQLSRLLPEDGGRIQSPKRCFKKQNRSVYSVQKTIILLIYHRHRLLDFTYFCHFCFLGCDAV